MRKPPITVGIVRWSVHQRSFVVAIVRCRVHQRTKGTRFERWWIAQDVISVVIGRPSTDK
jgi:hypothetical protein